MSDALFVTLIEEQYRMMGAKRLADLLLVSQPTIVRWISGMNLPHPALRKQICEVFEDSAS